MDTPRFSYFATGSFGTSGMLDRMKQTKRDEMRSSIEAETGRIDIQFTFRKLWDAPASLAIVDIWEARADIGVPPLLDSGMPSWTWIA
jgi:hypothetical protein